MRMGTAKNLLPLIAVVLANHAYSGQLRCARPYLDGYDLDRFNSAVRASLPRGFVRARHADYCSNDDFARGWTSTNHHVEPDGVEVWHDIACERGFERSPAWSCEASPKRRLKTTRTFRGHAQHIDLFMENMPTADARALLDRTLELLEADRTLGRCPGLEPPTAEDAQDWPTIRARAANSVVDGVTITTALEHGAYSVDLGGLGSIEFKFTMVREGHACFDEYVVVD